MASATAAPPATSCAQLLAQAVERALSSADATGALEREIALVLHDPSSPCVEEQSCSGLSRTAVLVGIIIPSCAAFLLLSLVISFLAAAGSPAGSMSDAASKAPDSARSPATWASSVFNKLYMHRPGPMREPGGTEGVQQHRASIDNAPPAGPDTTLLLSDVQNSTSLWEMLPTELMDTCMQLHDECFRKFMVKHSGYESATEGDAFILAFANPASALRFAMDVQLALLDAPWPGQLLIYPDTRPVHVLSGEVSEAPVPKEEQGIGKLRLKSSPFLGISPSMGRPSLDREGPGKPRPLLRATKSFKGLSWLPRSSLEETDGAVPASTDEMDTVEPDLDDLALAMASSDGDCHTWGKQLGACLPRVRENAQNKGATCMIFRGFRVRMGIHTGIENAADVTYDPVSGRTVYSGVAMDTARAVADAAPGGGVLLSLDAFVRLPHALLGSTQGIDAMVNNPKKRQQRSSLDAGAATKWSSVLGGETIDALVVYAGDFKMTKLSNTASPMSLYMAVPGSIPGRLPWLPATRNTVQHALGTVAAPLGTVTITFLYVVGAASLLTDQPALGRKALSNLQHVCIQELTRCEGYAVEVADGLVLAAFPHPSQAVTWAIACNELMQAQVWPAALLKHEACTVTEQEPAPWAHPAQPAWYQSSSNHESTLSSVNLDSLGAPISPLLLHPGSSRNSSSPSTTDMHTQQIVSGWTNTANRSPSGGLDGTGSQRMRIAGEELALRSSRLRPGAPRVPPAPPDPPAAAPPPSTGQDDASGDPWSLPARHKSLSRLGTHLQTVDISTMGTAAPSLGENHLHKLQPALSGAVGGGGNEPGKARKAKSARHLLPSIASWVQGHAGHEKEAVKGSGSRRTASLSQKASGGIGASWMAALLSPNHSRGSAESGGASGLLDSGVGDLALLREPIEGVPVIDKPRAGRRARLRQAHTNDLELGLEPAAPNTPAARRASCQPSVASGHTQRRPSLANYLSNAVAKTTLAIRTSLAKVEGSVAALAGRDIDQLLTADMEMALAGAQRAAETQEHSLHEGRVKAAREAGVLLPGVHLKIGIDMGKVLASVHQQTGRIHYRGKVMNRAARVAAKCQRGQVMATEIAWETAIQRPEAIRARGLCGDHLGEFELKGVPGLVSMVHCWTRTEEADRRLLKMERAKAPLSRKASTDTQPTLLPPPPAAKPSRSTAPCNIEELLALTPPGTIRARAPPYQGSLLAMAQTSNHSASSEPVVSSLHGTMQDPAAPASVSTLPARYFLPQSSQMLAQHAAPHDRSSMQLVSDHGILDSVAPEDPSVYTSLDTLLSTMARAPQPAAALLDPPSAPATLPAAPGGLASISDLDVGGFASPRAEAGSRHFSQASRGGWQAMPPAAGGASPAHPLITHSGWSATNSPARSSSAPRAMREQLVHAQALPSKYAEALETGQPLPEEANVVGTTRHGFYRTDSNGQLRFVLKPRV